MIVLPRPNSSPEFMAAAWELHRERGGGYLPISDVRGRMRDIASRVILPPLPQPRVILPPLPQPRVILPPLPGATK